MLQHTLTEVTFSEVSGSTNIEWDAIGVSRHFLKLWLFERGTMESISGHYESGETLPSHILDNLCNLSRHMAGTKLCRKIYFSNLDLQLHLHNESFIKIMENLWPQHLLFRLAPMDYHPCGFEDVISGPWGSSFYSDIWSQMLAADVFSAFSEVGFSNQEEITALGRR